MKPGTTISHYEILEQLGGGGMGVVYKARDTKLMRDVALKFLPAGMSRDEEANARFTQEAQAASGLDHPNICTIHEIGETDDGQLFIAMAYYEGQTLKYRLDDGPTDPDVAERITRQLLEGLSAAHKKGIIHRDVKPANIMVTDEGRVKILDFGLAKLSGGLELTKSHSTVGTAYYMSPEQVRGEEVDERTDLWSAGVVLYQMLTGRRPFEGDYEHAISYAILNERQKDVGDDVPTHLKELLGRLLSKDRDRRPSSAAEAASLLGEVSVSRSEVQPVKSPKPWKLIYGLGLTAVVAVVTAITLLSRNAPELKPESTVKPVPTIAVLPFEVSGDEDLEYLREGMVRLLGNKLDGLGDLASADANSVLSFVDRHDGRVDVEVGKELASHMQATGFILGSVISAGNTIRMSASLYGAEGEKQATQEWTGRSDSLLIPAIDSMAIRLVADRLNLEGREVASVAALTSRSIEALKHYLAGERLLRQGRDFDVQVEEFRRAVQIDSTFSLAWYGLSRAAGWTVRYRDLVGPARAAAVRHSASLPPKIRIPMLARNLSGQDRWQEAEGMIKPYLRQHPQDAEAWWVLGEIVYHNYGRIGQSSFVGEQYFEKAAAIDPSNTEYQVHIWQQLKNQGRFRDMLRMAETRPSIRASAYSKTALAILIGDSSGTPQLAALENATLDPNVAFRLVEFSLRGARPEIARMALRSLDKKSDIGFRIMQYYRLASGQFDEAMRQSPLSDEHLIALWVPRILPFKSFSQEELQRMRQVIADWDTTLNPLSLNWSPVLREDSSETWYPYKYDELKAFTRGGLSLALGDQPAADRAAESLWNPATSPYDSTLGKSLHNLLKAMEALRDNDLDAAMDYVSAAALRRAAGTGLYPFHSELLSRWIRAEILLAKGDHETARNWYRTFRADNAMTPWSAFIAPSHFKEAVCDEALGDYDYALKNYGLFIEYWQDADPDLQPIVDEARAGIERIQRMQTREPEG